MIVRSKFIDLIGNPLPNVAVVIGKFKGVTSNNQGMFEMEANPNDIVEISHLGMKTIYVKAADIKPVITLSDSVDTLDEIVLPTKQKTVKTPFYKTPLFLISSGILLFSAIVMLSKGQSNSDLEYTRVQV